MKLQSPTGEAPNFESLNQLLLQMSELRRESYRYRRQHQGNLTQAVLARQFEYVQQLQELRTKIERAVPAFYLEYLETRQCYALVPRPQCQKKAV